MGYRPKAFQISPALAGTFIVAGTWVPLAVRQTASPGMTAGPCSVRPRDPAVEAEIVRIGFGLGRGQMRLEQLIGYAVRLGVGHRFLRRVEFQLSC